MYIYMSDLYSLVHIAYIGNIQLKATVICKYQRGRLSFVSLQVSFTNILNKTAKLQASVNNKLCLKFTNSDHGDLPVEKSLFLLKMGSIEFKAL